MILFFQKMILYSVSRASTAYQTRPRASLLQISSCILHHFASLFSIITANPPRVGISQRIEYPPSIHVCLYSNYPLSPTKYKFEKTGRIYAIIMKFIHSFKCLKGKLSKSTVRFQMLQVAIYDDIKEKLKDVQRRDKKVNQNFVCLALVMKADVTVTAKHNVILTQFDISNALCFLFKKGSNEVKQFYQKKYVEKISFESDGILYSKMRLFDGQRFKLAGGLEETDILAEYGLNTKVPVLDRYSPLSYSIGDYIHTKISKHSGYETCHRDSIKFCHIIQSMSLYREIGDDCIKCAKLRKKYVEVETGPIADEQMVVAPPFWVTMMDIYGPMQTYVPGHERNTRSKKALDYKTYIIVFLCPTTKMVNLQVIEGKSADAITEGITRMSCEQGGVPNYVLVDQDSSIIKVLKEAEIDMKDLQHRLFTQKGIQFKTCPVSGHNYHGAVERKIYSIQKIFEEMGLEKMRLHSTGLQTFCKLAENECNNLPLGYCYGRQSDNSPVLKIITPNLLKIGRLNSRSLDGPIRLPKGPGELMEKVEKVFKVFYSLWNTTLVPLLLKSPKWFKSDEMLQVNDIVYFQKEDKELSSKWSVGKIVEVTYSKDGLVRRVIIQYHNANEDQPRRTDRAARSIVKLFNISDQDWTADMAEVEKLVDILQKESNTSNYMMNYTGSGLRYRLIATGGHEKVKRETGVQNSQSAKLAKCKVTKRCKNCCCPQHCSVAVHGKVKTLELFNPSSVKMLPNLLDNSWLTDEEDAKIVDDVVPDYSGLMGMLSAVNTDLTGATDVVSMLG